MEFLSYIRDQWDRVAAFASACAGSVAMILGWIGASTTPYVAEQVPYMISGGLGGLLLFTLGGVLWLSADLRDEWRKLDEISQRIAAENSRVAPTSGEVPREVAVSGTSGSTVPPTDVGSPS